MQEFKMSKISMQLKFLGWGALLCLSLGSLFVGDVPLSVCLKDGALLHKLIFDLRLPRTILALLAGASLGFTGAFLQGLLKNPLADVSVMGLSASAIFGAVVFMMMGWSFLPAWTGFLGGCCGVLLVVSVFLMLKNARQSLTSQMILTGIVLNGFFSALLSFVFVLVRNPYAQLEAFAWMMGSVAVYDWGQIFFIGGTTALGLFLLVGAAPLVDALSFGEEFALTIGYPFDRFRLRIILGLALCVGPLTALIGAISFVGLIVPHLLRPFVGAKPRALLWPSAFGGAFFLLGADLALRLLPFPDLRVGMLTALLGTPFFIYILYFSGKKYDFFS